MSLTGPKLTNHGFFANQVVLRIESDGQHPVFGDSGVYQAMSVALVDCFLQHPRAHASLLNNILTSHFKYFPAHRPTLPGLVTSTERFQELVKDVSMHELVHYMAYTLHQFAMTEINAHHQKYRDAFVGCYEGEALKDVCEYSTSVDPKTIVRALAKALSIGIEVRVVERLKPLPMRLRYNVRGDEQPHVVLQLKDNYYTPHLISSDRFALTNSRPIRKLQPVASSMTYDTGLAEIRAARIEEDERLIKSFEAIYNSLYAMVIAGELNIDDLITIYIESMPNRDNLPEDVMCDGLEHGSQRYFDEIISARRGTQSNISPTEENGLHVERELVHVLAREIAVQRRTADHVFAHIDEDQETVSDRLAR